MHHPLADTIDAICEEAGLLRPDASATGAIVLEIEGTELRFLPQPGHTTVMTGVLGSMEALAAVRRCSSADLMADCLLLAGARLAKLAPPEILSLEPADGKLILWRRLDHRSASMTADLAAAESMLNEASFWKRWLGLPS